jgi:DNA-binding transcriptional ArsR family regulator
MNSGPENGKVEEEVSLSLSSLLDALRDSTRRQILLRLQAGERRCSSFGDLGSKTALSYHFAILQKAGLTDARQDGTSKFLSLSLSRIESTFPGLLASVLESARKEHSSEIAPQ